LRSRYDDGALDENAHPSQADIRLELERLRAENRQLRGLLGLDRPDEAASIPTWEPTLFPEHAVHDTSPRVNQRSRPEAKVALFRSIFVGREDVYARRWENSRTGKSGWSPTVVGGWANARKSEREYVPFSVDVVRDHLAGEIHAGLYPLLQGDTCQLLACDFDGPTWPLDAGAYLDVARSAGIPVALERSRSGAGAHVWAFFSERVAAASARRIGVHFLREAMTVRAELDLASYDRLFPTQDFMPKGSFGNLIALPLQGACRKRGTTVFLDPATLEAYEDQWTFLSTLGRSSVRAINSLAESLPQVAAGLDGSTFRRPRLSGPQPKPPEVIRATAGAMLSVDRIGMPPALIAALKHLASVHNPDYYEKERLRFSTWNTPRFLRMYSETLEQILLPRGVREQAERIVAEAGSKLVVSEGCTEPAPIDVQMRSVLTDGQAVALQALVPRELGVLVAPPAAGKTVIACALIAHRRVPTLIIVDRRPLVEQWRDRLVQHLGVSRSQIGELGGEHARAKGLIDISMVQSLAKHDDLAELTSDYGLVIVDECHHVPARTFERCVRQIPVANWLGLTATPYRRDKLESLISMFCGPVRYDMKSSHPGGRREFERELIVHPTNHTAGADGTAIQDVFRAIVDDDRRTQQIGADIAAAVAAGRNCLVLSQWTEHLARLVDDLSARGRSALVLQGGMGKKARAAVVGQLWERTSGRGILLVATGSFLGEGFDCPPLDTLFLTFPLAFKGRLVQYVGRVLRPTDGKTRVEVHDYVDVNVPVLARMHSKRLAAYSSLGFDVPPARSPSARTWNVVRLGQPHA